LEHAFVDNDTFEFRVPLLDFPLQLVISRSEVASKIYLA